MFKVSMDSVVLLYYLDKEIPYKISVIYGSIIPI